MRSSWLVAVLLAGGVSGIPALAADSPARRPQVAAPADWVLSAPVPAPPSHAEGAAVVDLLLDQQVHLIDGGEASYRANMFRIATAQGLDNGALEISWDPSLETLTLHHYRILRGQQVIDLLGDGSRVQVVQREKNLENATLDGELTASQQPEDLRVGDVIDLAYTIVRRDPATGGRAFGLYGPSDGVPYGRYRLRVTWPAGRAVQWRAAPGVVQPQLTRRGDDNELLADLTDTRTLPAPANAPARFGLVNLAELSEFPDWPTVSRTYAGLFAKAQTLAPDSPLHAEIARIAASSPDPVVRAERALALVEEQVRYLFVGIDDGGFVPASADQTWARRYGDCKGKTALLIALLDGLGITARPVLVDTQDGDATAHRLPTMGAFDHVLVEATIAGRSYWLDGTREGDTRLARLVTPTYDVGLPATAAGSDLIPLIPPAPTAPEDLTSLTLDASAGIEAPARATGEMRYRGDTAATMRMKYASYGKTDLEATLRKLWRDTYDFVTPENVSAREDATTGDFVLTMTGTARMDWYVSGASRWYELDRARVGWKFDTARDGELNQDAPFAVTYPQWWANHETIVLPRHGEGFHLQAKDVDREVGGLYALHRKVALADGVVTMDNDTRALKAELPATQADDVRDQLQTLSNDGVFVRLPPTYLYTDADLAALAGNRPALLRARVQNGAVRLDRGDTAAAMADANAALAIDPKATLAHALLAVGLAREGKDDAHALREADIVLAADPHQSLGWNARGTVRQRQNDLTGAVEAWTHVIDANADDVAAHVARGTAQLGLGHGAAALADFDAAQAQMPTLRLAALRAAALELVGRRDEALEAADAALAATPDDRRVRAMRLAIREDAGDGEGALADAEWLLAHQPTAHDYLTHAELLPRSAAAQRESDIAAALTRDPANAPAWLLRAQDAMMAGHLEAAESDLAQAAQRKADALTMTGLRLDLLARRGQSDAALKLANETVGNRPGHAPTLNMVCWFKATRNIALGTALADCDAALRIEPDAPAYLDSRALVRLRNGDTKGAITDYSAALRQRPGLVGSLYGRGIAWARLGDRNRALTDLSRARTARPDIDTIWADYGVTPPAGF